VRLLQEEFDVKRLLVGGAILALCVGGMGSSFAGGNGAQKASLSPINPKNCGSEGESDGTGHGFVIFNAPGKPGATNGDILGEVSLKRGTPNADYAVRVSDSGGCHLLDAVLSTNGVGNGNAHIVTTGQPGAYYVVLQNLMDDTDGYSSSPVTVN
jgi:hypothetical protein